MILPTTRQQFGIYLTHRGLTGYGAEIGVRQAAFAAIVLADWEGTLLLVDPWRHLPNYHDPANVTDAEHQRRMDGALRTVKKFGPRAQMLRMVSREAAALLRPESLSFIHLDAQHTFLSCREDLLIWYPLLKPGGMFSGHDYFNGSMDLENCCPSDDPTGEFPCRVKQAVDEFAAECGKQVLTTMADVWPSWWWHK